MAHWSLTGLQIKPIDPGSLQWVMPPMPVGSMDGMCNRET